MVCLIFTAEDPFAAGGGQRVVLGFEGLVVGGDPLSMITPALIRGSDRSVARSRQKIGASGRSVSRRPSAVESRCVGWMTAYPWAAQKSASGPYP